MRSAGLGVVAASRLRAAGLLFSDGFNGGLAGGWQSGGAGEFDGDMVASSGNTKATGSNGSLLCAKWWDTDTTGTSSFAESTFTAGNLWGITV